MKRLASASILIAGVVVAAGCVSAPPRPGAVTAASTSSRSVDTTWSNRTTLPPPPSNGKLSFPDLVARVRAQRPGARWVDAPPAWSVGDGATVQVTVKDVDDPALAGTICNDVLAVLADRAQPTVLIRSSAGAVMAIGEQGTCEVSAPE